VVEGVRGAENARLDQFLDFSIQSVDEIGRGSEQGHFALKLTAYISTDVMEKVSQAQERFLKEVIQVNSDARDNSVLTEGQLVKNLANLGITDYSK